MHARGELHPKRAKNQEHRSGLPIVGVQGPEKDVVLSRLHVSNPGSLSNLISTGRVKSTSTLYAIGIIQVFNLKNSKVGKGSSVGGALLATGLGTRDGQRLAVATLRLGLPTCSSGRRLVPLGLDHLLQRMLVENTDEGTESAVEKLIEGRKLRLLGSLFAFLPLDFDLQDLHGAHDIADADLGSGTREAHAAVAATYGADEPCARQQVHDLERVLKRDIAPLGDLGDLDEIWRCEGTVEQNADGVVCRFAQAHDLSSSLRADFPTRAGIRVSLLSTPI